MTQKEHARRKTGYMGFFSILLSITLVTAGLMWEAYGHLPGQYYMPISFSLLILAGIVGYVILVRYIEI